MYICIATCIMCNHADQNLITVNALLALNLIG